MLERNTSGDRCAQLVTLYSGDLLEDCDWLWADPLREDLRGRVLDALVQSAELDEQEGTVVAALASLERAIKIDPYAEYLYRRKMRLQVRAGLYDAVRSTFADVSGRLEELGLDPDDETIALVRSGSPPETERLQDRRGRPTVGAANDFDRTGEPSAGRRGRTFPNGRGSHPSTSVPDVS